MSAVSVSQASMPDSDTRLLGELLLERELITDDELSNALKLQGEIGGRLGSLLIRIGAVSEEVLLEVLSLQLGMPLLSRTQLPDDFSRVAEWLKVSGLSLDWWLDQELIAWQCDEAICCAANDPLNNALEEILASRFGEQPIHWQLLRNHDLEYALNALSDAAQGSDGSYGDSGYLRELAEEAPVIEFVNNLLAQAFEQRASDVHIEPEKTGVVIRFRIDGVLYTRLELPFERYSAIGSRIKLISGMDIAEQRLPQDGQLETRVGGNELDVRASTLPGVHGESIVMRLLPKEKKRFQIDSLGLLDANRDNLQRLSQEAHGIVLVTGPTGSGKSTTLYSVLENINTGDKKIITVEDPVEYRLEGITQVQTKEAIDYTFAKALRSILRQDPDVIMIGEIRDRETAEIAIQSSLTGHLVLSTLHTNDAASAFTRLVDMGIEPFLVATPVRAVLAQRLVRTLCGHCAKPAQVVEDVQARTLAVLPEALKGQAPAWAEPVGCPHCQGTGYSGRVGLHELITVTPEIQHAIIQGESPLEIQRIACSQGSVTLRDDGFIKAYQGITSVDEVLRVTVA